ncbi:MAG: gluconate 2-dehydrogenase subunit 3 family protein [Gammaproteobacteria bacterium]|jgi:gluconate 2-dehydrogenase gamma chain
MANKKNESPANPSRRNLLKSAGLVGAAVAGSGAAAQAVTGQAPGRPEAQPRSREALEVLTAAEAETLEAITDRILPSDENGPGAREARAVHYIDRSLASDNASARGNYAAGLAAVDDYARKLHGHPFHVLSPELQDTVLLTVIQGQVPGFNPSGGGFFNMVRSHTLEGTFSDPYYGGNQDFIGWDMLRYPGVRIGVSENDVALGGNLAPAHQSAYDIPTFTKVIASTGRRGNGN